MPSEAMLRQAWNTGLQYSKSPQSFTSRQPMHSYPPDQSWRAQYGRSAGQPTPGGTQAMHRWEAASQIGVAPEQWASFTQPTQVCVARSQAGAR